MARYELTESQDKVLERDRSAQRKQKLVRGFSLVLMWVIVILIAYLVIRYGLRPIGEAIGEAMGPFIA